MASPSPARGDQPASAHILDRLHHLRAGVDERLEILLGLVEVPNNVCVVRADGEARDAPSRSSSTTAAGILGEHDRVEGGIVQMEPIGSRHAGRQSIDTNICRPGAWLGGGGGSESHHAGGARNRSLTWCWPGPDGYASVRHLRRGANLDVLAIAGLTVGVDEILG